MNNNIRKRRINYSINVEYNTHNLFIHKITNNAKNN